MVTLPSRFTVTRRREELEAALRAQARMIRSRASWIGLAGRLHDDEAGKAEILCRSAARQRLARPVGGSQPYCGVMFRLRDATGDDLPRLQEVFLQSSLSNEGDRAALIDHPEALVFPAVSLSSGRVRVATIESDLIVGFATTVTKDGFVELVDLFTDPDWMRRGVATLLIDDVVAFATAIGVSRVSVIGNPHATQFYQQAGFVTESQVGTDFGPGLRMHLTVPT